MHAFMESVTDRIYPLFLQHPVISTDSRKAEPGSLFFALKGEAFNGNEFAAQALDRGASNAIIDEEKYATDSRCILVTDVLSTLQQLALYHRMQFSIPVIAITGSNGKTTTKELIHKVLSEKYVTLATSGNLNNHIGVPLTLLRLNKETEIAIIEMGANHPGEIDFLCRIALPGFGLITNIGKAHLGGFCGFDGVIRTKTELSRFLREQGGIMFVNKDDDLLKMHIQELEKITYGTPPALVELMEVAADPFVKMKLKFPDQSSVWIASKLYGRYNSSNILAAATIGYHFGIAPEKIKMAIESYQPANNRSQFVTTTLNTLILDAYNANPSSMEAAITMFAEAGYPHKTVILGDMLELGDESDKEHLDILKLTEQQGFQHVYLVGPIFTRMNTNRENTCFQDCELAKMWLEHHKIENSTVLIKGSRGIGLEKLTAVL